MIQDPHGEAARVLSQAATVGSTGDAVRDENAQARRARAGERHLRTSVDMLLTQLSTPPQIAPNGAMQTAAPENVLYIQRAPGAMPEPDIRLVREYLRRVVLIGGDGQPVLQDPNTILEDLHAERRNASVLVPAQRVQQALYSQAQGPAWQPAAAGEQLPSGAQGAGPQPVPGQPYLGGESASERTMLIPPVPAQGPAGPASLPPRPQPRAAGYVQAGHPQQATASQATAPAGAAALVSAADGDAQTPDPSRAGALPPDLADGAPGQTLTFELPDRNIEAGKETKAERPLALAAARSGGKAGARRSAAGGGDD